MGDTGPGAPAQYEVGEQMAAFHDAVPLRLRDHGGRQHLRGSTRRRLPKQVRAPYKALLDAKVKFYAALGNHDNPTQRFYKPFNMGGERYYTFRRGAGAGGVRFFALDSNYLDKEQLDWLEKELGSLEVGLEDRLLPPPALLLGQDARLDLGPARAARAALRETA